MGTMIGIVERVTTLDDESADLFKQLAERVLSKALWKIVIIIWKILRGDGMDANTNKKNSLAIENPELAKQWHPDKNGQLTPYAVTTGSGKKVWWQCEIKHEWEATIASRATGIGCPYCSGRRATSENSLQTLNPELAQEWHPSKNGDLTSSDVKAGSNLKVWWICAKGHEWQATVHNRSKGGGCPYCAGKRVSVENNLQTLNPDLAKQWHSTKNDDLTPSDVTANSGKRAWWVCEKGHEWNAIIGNRSKGGGCPYCVGKRASAENNLQAVNPELAKQWHYAKNGDLTPSDATAGSRKKAWWQCEKGHEWEAAIVDRANGSGCPFCSGRRVCNDNSLHTLLPDLAKQWHPTKNGDLTPSEVTAGSNKRVWWVCESGHEWETVVADRSIGRGCPYCSGRYATSENNLQVLNPELARQWHPVKNGNLAPSDVMAGSGKKVWWLCEKNHEWEAVINSRSSGVGCPYCSGKYVSSENNLQTLSPELAKQWHPTKNGDLTPSDVTLGSNKRVWWQCRKGHEWETVIANRSSGSGCPFCSGQRVGIDNSLQVLNPSLSKQWHPTKNRNLTPSDVTVGSNKKVWWQCEKEHEWESTIKYRSKGNGCPYCSGKRATLENCLQALNPELAKQWHPNKNGDLTPSDVMMGSSKKVWWQCESDHEWEATIISRTRGNGCPYCIKL